MSRATLTRTDIRTSSHVTSRCEPSLPSSNGGWSSTSNRGSIIGMDGWGRQAGRTRSRREKITPTDRRHADWLTAAAEVAATKTSSCCNIKVLQLLLVTQKKLLRCSCDQNELVARLSSISRFLNRLLLPRVCFSSTKTWE